MSNDSSQASTLAMTQSVAVWFALTPKLTDIRKASVNDLEFIADLHHTEIVAGIAAMSVGAIGAFMAGNAWPFVAAFGTVAVLAGLYEYSLVQPKPHNLHSQSQGPTVSVDEGLQT